MINIKKLSNDVLKEAVSLLNSDKLVAFPTETVYGLGANAYSSVATTQIYSVKQRPRFNPLIVHYYDIEQANNDVVFNDMAYKLAKQFWPGPLTLVLNKKPGCKVNEVASANLPTLAIRIPSHHIAQELLKAFGKPIVAPSANPSGRLSPSTALHVKKLLEDKVSLIIDGGNCDVGVESTILDVTNKEAKILRHGAITAEQLGILTNEVKINDIDKIIAPGMLSKHYSPTCPIRIGFDNPKPGEALLAFGKNIPSGFEIVINLSETEDLVEAANKLFNSLHKLESLNVSSIATMPIPYIGLGMAINDKLKRAASPN